MLKKSNGVCLERESSCSWWFANATAPSLHHVIKCILDIILTGIASSYGPCFLMSYTVPRVGFIKLLGNGPTDPVLTLPVQVSTDFSLEEYGWY